MTTSLMRSSYDRRLVMRWMRRAAARFPQMSAASLCRDGWRGRHVYMGLNLTDAETIALLSQLAKRTGRTMTATVRELAREKLAQLDAATDNRAQSRTANNLCWLHEEVWPRTTGKEVTKYDIDDLLGYDEMTGE